MSMTLPLEMRGNQFPFGELDNEHDDFKKVLVRKRHLYKSNAQYEQMMAKIEKLKGISHKNSINLRIIQDADNGYIDLFYPYVPVPLEESFNENPQQTVKELHKQFIELTIHLAKNDILTSFSPGRCGVIMTENKSLLKYYLPLNQIIVTNNVNMLQRSVQLFSVQSMHFLDTLSHSVMNTTLENSSQCSFNKRIKMFPESKKRKESQPVTLMFNQFRKFSTSPAMNPQLRKLSNLSKQLSEFSEMRRQRTKESSRVSVGSFNTMNPLMSVGSDYDLAQSRHLSESKVIRGRVSRLRDRSLAAMKEFKDLKKRMQWHEALSILLQKIKR